MKTKLHIAKFSIAVFILITSWSGVISQVPLVVNLSDAKTAVKEYYRSGQYNRQVDSIIADAIRIVKQFPIQNNSAFVFDIDETALSNFEYEIKYDFGYIQEEWDKWIKGSKAPSIPQVKMFYDSLLSYGYKIIFITGRSFVYYEATYRNLKNAGYSIFDTLICRSTAEQNIAAKEYKTTKRKELTEKGYSIVGSIGDQWSDLEGGYTIFKIKIPNYMYIVK